MLPDAQLADFHFIRPLWLLLIPYVLWVHMKLRRAYSASIQWKGSIAPDLLTHLTVAGRNQFRIRPYQLMTCLLDRPLGACLGARDHAVHSRSGSSHHRY